MIPEEISTLLFFYMVTVFYDFIRGHEFNTFGTYLRTDQSINAIGIITARNVICSHISTYLLSLNKHFVLLILVFGSLTLVWIEGFSQKTLRKNSSTFKKVFLSLKVPLAVYCRNWSIKKNSPQNKGIDVTIKNFFCGKSII